MPDGGVVAESGSGAGGAGGPLVPPAEATRHDDAASPLPSPRQDDRSPGALLRRSIDAVGAALLLALLAPLLLAVALMLRAESGASVLARRRVGTRRRRVHVAHLPPGSRDAARAVAGGDRHRRPADAAERAARRDGFGRTGPDDARGTCRTRHRPGSGVPPRHDQPVGGGRALAPADAPGRGSIPSLGRSRLGAAPARPPHARTGQHRRAGELPASVSS
jgi:hypothetical protein